MAQLLKRQLGKVEIHGKDRIMEGLSSIDTTATKMTEQIDELLDLARLQMGQPLKLRLRQVDLVRLVRDVAAEQQRITERHRIRVETKLPELIGEWDAGRLGRVLTNLVSNAIKYSPDGGAVNITVTLEERSGQPWAVLTVYDQGIGIPPGDLPMVFEGFHRAGNVASQIAGTGLGLTSARQLVLLHGGTIEATSEEGAGSAFTVRLPLTVQDSNEGDSSADESNVPVREMMDS